MTQQNNGQLGDWAPQCAQAKPIEIATKITCLELFRRGNGYRKAAKVLGLKQYTVRDWLRRFKSGDVSWSTRDGQVHYGCAEAKDLVPGDLSAEEKIKWLEAQNHLLRFHYTALVEHASGFSPEEFAKKKS